MAGDYGLSDLRFVGYDNGALAEQVEGLRNGPGSETLSHAASALVKLAEGLADTDDELRKQLKQIGVFWEGEASEGGTLATRTAAIYAEQAQDPMSESAKGVGAQTETFQVAKHSAPDAGTLRGPTQESGFDQIVGFLGHTTDHAKEVKATNQARDRAVDAMTGYQSNSSDALGRSQALPVPPGMNLVAEPVDSSTHTSGAGVHSPSGGFTPASGGPSGGPGSSFTGSGGGGAVSATPTLGSPSVTGPGPVVGPGPVSGGGPFAGGSPLLPTNPANPLAPALRANPLLMAEAATMMGAGGASGAGAGAQGDRLARGGGGLKAGSGKGATPLGAAPEEEARAARNAEKFGARTGRAPGSIMQPAAAGGGGRGAEGEDDQEHVRRYGIDSGDVFDDDRVVAPESIGDDDDER